MTTCWLYRYIISSIYGVLIEEREGGERDGFPEHIAFVDFQPDLSSKTPPGK